MRLKNVQKRKRKSPALSIEAARRRATLGEISDALEGEFGRYKAQIKLFREFTL